eukprot:COSAG01_NODE_32311_length_583_cov_1.008264_3_plen_41_part_01
MMACGRMLGVVRWIVNPAYDRGMGVIENPGDSYLVYLWGLV